MRARFSTLGAACLVAGLVATCASSAPGGHHRGEKAPAHLDIATAVPIDSESAGVHVEIFRCGEALPAATGQIGFSAGSLDEFQGFATTPVRLAKDHIFAQRGFSIQHGCYYATAQPLDIHSRPLDKCATSRTPEIPLGPGVERALLLVARCGDKPFDTPTVGGRLNFAPMLADLNSRFDHSAKAFEVCAHTFDAEADQVSVEWDARTDSGRQVEPTDTWHGAQTGARRTTCARFPASDEPVEVSAVARDGSIHSARGFLSHEAYRLYRHGVAAPSRDRHNTQLPAHSSLSCAESVASAVESWTYWIRRDDEVLSPTTDLSTVRPDDSVQVEIEVADGCEDLAIEFAALSQGSTIERDSGTFSPGAHVLWVDVPERPFSLALAVEFLGEYHVLDSHQTAQPEDAAPSLVGVAH